MADCKAKEFEEQEGTHTINAPRLLPTWLHLAPNIIASADLVDFVCLFLL